MAVNKTTAAKVNRTTDVVDENVAQETPFLLGEKKYSGIEQAVEGDLSLEAFMEQELDVIIHPTGRDGENPVPLIWCNETPMPIPRKQRVKVKRKYVEILARCRITDYDQAVHDPSKPQNIQMIPNSSLLYPFTVFSDPHPDGREWLDQILSQPL